MLKLCNQSVMLLKQLYPEWDPPECGGGILNNIKAETEARPYLRKIQEVKKSLQDCREEGDLQPAISVPRSCQPKDTTGDQPSSRERMVSTGVDNAGADASRRYPNSGQTSPRIGTTNVEIEESIFVEDGRESF